MDTQNILEIKDVDQVFRSGFWMKQKQVLHKISFDVPKKSVVGFLGENGAGKTTLIYLIVGIRRPTAGSIFINQAAAHTAKARSQIGYLPERPYFPDHLTGIQFLTYFGTLAGMSRAHLNKRIPSALEAVNMDHAKKLELRCYSKGMLQRIGIAQALLHEPELLILDEPMSGLDPLGRKEMRELIQRLAGEGKTIFFSSHVIPDVEAICDRVAVIQRGKLIEYGPIGGLLSRGPLQTEIAFKDFPIEDARLFQEFTSVREMPEGIRATTSSQDGVHSALRRLTQKSAKILWVTPIRPSLEDLFLTQDQRMERKK